jgi:TPP-dependent pyruvate/acetoin dehydrogenase alpha subunit
VGLVGNSAIVGGGIPIATGLALAAQMQGNNRVSVAFFGDGAADEGTLYESVNFAILKKLPVLFVLENNQFSVCSRVSARQCGAVVFLKQSPDLLFSAHVDGNDVLAVYRAARSSSASRTGCEATRAPARMRSSAIGPRPKSTRGNRRTPLRLSGKYSSAMVF